MVSDSDCVKVTPGTAARAMILHDMSCVAQMCVFQICFHEHAGQDPKVLLDMSAEEDFQAKMQEANFGTATSALTILRYAAFSVIVC